MSLRLSDCVTRNPRRSVAKTVLAAEDEEVWIEIDNYRDQEHCNTVLFSLRKDPEAGPTFGALDSVVSQGYSSITGVFYKLKI